MRCKETMVTYFRMMSYVIPAPKGDIISNRHKWLNSVVFKDKAIFPNFSLIKDLFHLKRKIFLLKRLIHNSANVAEELPDIRLETHNHELHYYCNKLAFQYEELAELITSLMNLNLALSDHRTNEVMRILTIFSVFFLPLTFVVGVYGMNFEFMPELQSRYGYPATLVGMAIATLLLYLWFRRKGWLRP